ncbi:MAG: hypothetical protein IJY93_07050 [Clostridia bacterium]|nr:hypothetical protein [Clostridia bacterium]
MNTTTKKRRISRIVETVKTIVLTLLLVSLIALVAVYIVRTRVYESVAAKTGLGSDFDKLWSVQSGTSPEGLDFAHLLPEFIGYKQSSSGDFLGSVADRDSISELYTLTKPCILELFGKDSTCRKLSADDGEARFSAAAQSDEFVYIRYHTPVLYQIIYAYAADKLTVSEEDVAAGESGSIGAHIRDLIIIPDKSFAAPRFLAYACDHDGNYFEFRPGDHFVSSEFSISQLTSGVTYAALYDFEFSADDRFLGLQPLTRDDIEIPDIVMEESSPIDEETRTALIRLFEYNLDKLDGYADNDSYVYVDTHSQLRVGSDTVSFYTHDATDETSLRGIDIESLLGYTLSDTAGLFDKLTAVDNLIRRLEEISEGLVGTDAQLCLGDVYSDGGLLVVEYFLTYNGIRISGEPYLRAVLTEKTVCELVLYPMSVRRAETTTLAIDSAYIFERLDYTGEVDSVSLRYGEAAVGWVLIGAK